MRYRPDGVTAAILSVEHATAGSQP
jgi:hypothetical protein